MPGALQLPRHVMRDLNAELRGTFLVVIGVLVCVSVAIGLMLVMFGRLHPAEADGGRWHVLHPDRLEQPAAQPPAQPAGRGK